MKYLKDNIKLLCIDNYKRRYYPILGNFIIDYKWQVFITGIKANRQYSICHILSKKKELVNQTWESRIHRLT